MTGTDGRYGDETGPITPASPTAEDDPAARSLLPAVPAPAAPVVATPAGWYPLNGEQRYWDGARWTEHRAPAPVPAYRPVAPPPVLVTDARTSGAEVVIAWVLTILTVGYLLPWAIAATRGKSNSLAIGLVNFFLGWTFIGWLVALVMACTAHQTVAAHPRW